eukprot:4706279-Prymnesium_polylepis.1
MLAAHHPPTLTAPSIERRAADGVGKGGDRAPARGWRSASSLPRIGSRLKLKSISLPDECDAESQQGKKWADVAHKMLSSRRHLAGS